MARSRSQAKADDKKQEAAEPVAESSTATDAAANDAQAVEAAEAQPDPEGDPAESAVSADEVKVEVIKKFRDKNTGSILEPGTILVITRERFEEVLSVDEFLKEV